MGDILPPLPDLPESSFLEFCFALNVSAPSFSSRPPWISPAPCSLPEARRDPPPRVISAHFSFYSRLSILSNTLDTFTVVTHHLQLIDPGLHSVCGEGRRQQHGFFSQVPVLVVTHGNRSWLTSDSSTEQCPAPYMR